MARQYLYNGKGERFAKVNVATPTSSVYFVYDEAGHLMGEYKPDGTANREYIWMDDTLVGLRSGYAGAKFQYVLTDHLGTPRAVVLPETNTIIWRWDLTGSAFGDHAVQTDPDGDATSFVLNLRYPGQYFDSESGLFYNYFRDYDPATGRYVQSDPIGLLGGVSTYSYVHGNSLRLIDPLGLDGWGISSGFDGHAGLLSGGGMQAETGAVVYVDGLRIRSVGMYVTDASWAGTNYTTLYYPGETDSSFMPHGGYTTYAVGASAGSGPGLFYTTADCEEEFYGPSDNWVLNTPFFSVSMSATVEMNPDDRNYTFGLSGPSMGLSFSRYRADTSISQRIVTVP